MPGLVLNTAAGDHCRENERWKKDPAVTINVDAPSAWAGEGNALPQRDAQDPKHRVYCTGKEEGKHKSYISFLRALNFMISPCYLEVNKDVPYIPFPVFIFLAK